MATKPAIVVDVVDPFYVAGGMHFDDLFGRYGGPVVVLNLVKAKEKVPTKVFIDRLN